MEEMTLEEFKKYCEENDYNTVEKWDNSRFVIVCQKCMKEATIRVQTREGAMGSEYTGWMSGFHREGGVLVKCLHCGYAMTIPMNEFRK